jgi:hypothetical protein
MPTNNGPEQRDTLSESMATGDLEIDVDVEDRIHIVPLGYERDRVIVPPLKMGADTVILVTHTQDDGEEEPDYYADIYEVFDEAAINIVEESCDIFDLYDALGTIAGLIQDYRDDEVHVNLATGGKVTAIAGMIACMVTEAATPYYVSAEEYGDHQTSPVAENVTNISNLPTYPIDSPTLEQVQMLAFIAEEGPLSKKALIEYAEEKELPFIADYEADDPKGKYRKLDSNILKPLVNDGAVIITEKGREKVAQVTADGENTLHAFRYMTNSETNL